MSLAILFPYDKLTVDLDKECAEAVVLHRNLPLASY